MTNYISNLSGQNFFSYKDFSVDFHPGVNVIIGKNDAGKSSLLRAILLIAQNKPSRADYISWHGGDLDIKMDIGGKSVGRFRNSVIDKETGKYKAGTKNLYTLDDEPFNAFGRGKVPPDIEQHINLSPMNINFQLDGPFLLDRTPPDVAKHYNSLVNLTIIDDTLKNINSTLKKEKTNLKIKENVVEQKTDELKEYGWLADAEKDLSALEKKKGYIKKLNSDWSTLSKSIETLNRLKKLEQEIRKITQFKDTVKALITDTSIIKGKQELYDKLKIQIETLERLKIQDKELKKIVYHKDVVKGLIKKSNQINALMDKEELLEKSIDKLKSLYENQKQYKTIIKYSTQAKALLVLDGQIEKDIADYNSLQKQLENRVLLNAKYDESVKELQTLKDEFDKLMPDECPLCGRGGDHG